MPTVTGEMEEALEEMNCMEDACVDEKCFVIKEMPGGYYDGWCIYCRKESIATSRRMPTRNGPVMRKTYKADFIRICNDHNIARPTLHMHSAATILH